MFQKLYRFLKNVFYGFTSAKFYQNLLRAPFSFSLKYFGFLIFLISVVYTIYFSVLGFPWVNKFLDNAPNLVKNLIPADYALEIKSGEANFMGKEPFLISIRDMYKNIGTDTTEKVTPANFLTIDTKTPFSESEYRKFDTILWLTKTSLIMPDKNNPASTNITIVPLKELGDMGLINQKIVLTTLTSSLPILRNIVKAVFFALLPLFFLFFLSTKLINVLVIGTLFFWLAKLAKFAVPLHKSWQLTIHASTLPVLIETVVHLTNTTIGIPFWYTLLTLIIIFFFLRNTEIKKV